MSLSSVLYLALRKPDRWAGWPWWYSADGEAAFVVDDFGDLVLVRHGRALSRIRADRRDDPSFDGV